MKPYDAWNREKQLVENKHDGVYVKEGDIWYAQLGINIGNEEDGKGDRFARPVMVYKRFGNMHLVIPLTTGGKDSRFYHTLPEDYF